MNCFTLNGETIPDFWAFLLVHDIGQGFAGASDPVYNAIINLKPGESWTGPLGTVARKPYDGDLDFDMNRQLELAHQDQLTQNDRAELRALTLKVHSYLFRSTS